MKKEWCMCLLPVQLQGVKEKKKNSFSQVLENATQAAYFNFKISTFLLFGGSRKKVANV